MPIGLRWLWYKSKFWEWIYFRTHIEWAWNRFLDNYERGHEWWQECHHEWDK